jgi:hypothetical protein
MRSVSVVREEMLLFSRRRMMPKQMSLYEYELSKEDTMRKSSEKEVIVLFSYVLGI